MGQKTRMKLFSNCPNLKWLKTVPSPFTPSPFGNLKYFIEQIDPNRVHRCLPMYNQFVQQNNAELPHRCPWMSVDVRGCPSTSIESMSLQQVPFIFLVQEVLRGSLGFNGSPNGARAPNPRTCGERGAFFVHLKITNHWEPKGTAGNRWEPVSTRAPLFDRRALFKSTCPFWSLAFFLIALQNTLQNRIFLQNKWSQR